MALSAASVLLPLKKLRVTGGCLNGLDFLWLEITRRCNLTCTHCYASSGPDLPLTERMTSADWCRVIGEARALGCRRLQFIGGEPTVHPDLRRLLEHATRVGFKRCEVFTNGTLLREDLLRTFKALSVLVHFSFYSFDPIVHDQITGQQGSFERTVEGIRQLVERRIRLAAGIILVPQNAGHLRKTKKLLRHLGVTTIGTDRVRGVGRGEQYVPGARPSGELCGECWSGKLCIDDKGEAHPCVFSRAASVGNVFEEGLGTIVTGARLQAFRREMFLGIKGGRNGLSSGGRLHDV
jgi:MoaA/NifB/PqqE/SkfB family radical SAM enzyme